MVMLREAPVPRGGQVQPAAYLTTVGDVAAGAGQNGCHGERNLAVHCA